VQINVYSLNTPHFLHALFLYPKAIESILAGLTGRMLGRGTIFTQATEFNVTPAYQFGLSSARDSASVSVRGPYALNYNTECRFVLKRV
jgi:hypothetical protein